MKTDSFIFSLKNGNILNSILSRVKRPEHAIYYCLDIEKDVYDLRFGYENLEMKTAVSNFSQDSKCKKRKPY